ncbi:hypothetical protein LTR05_006238 [Lithohypha guttulata]|uniref:Uncharacterized protein n=1 Tax=Lithohypha guttulata TaxID=1690604 RepID=A0AAN7Y9P7_9EURO|nr:hypothetical protein LTR05_006238 [Lithohypha guttulata]
MKRVLLLSLEDYPDLGEIYYDFIDELSKNCVLLRATTVKDAIKHLVQNPREPLYALFVEEPTLVQYLGDNEEDDEQDLFNGRVRVLADAIAAFTRNGGTTVFAYACSNLVSPNELNTFSSDILNLL